MDPLLISNPLPAIRDVSAIIHDMCETAAMFWQRGWAFGTSSTYSVVLNRSPLELLTTAGGRDKSRLTAADFVLVRSNGSPVDCDQPLPSADVILHALLAEERSVGAILHTHSVWSTLLSDAYFSAGGVEITGYEMLKGLDGITTHEATVWVEVLDNSQDILEMAEKVLARLRHPSLPLEHGFMVRKHGLFTWGRDLAEARRHVEVFEFLFECLGRKLMLGASGLFGS